MGPYRFLTGDAPVLMSIPHVGTAIPAAIEARMTERGRARPDTDWHLDRLYDFAAELGIPVLQAVWSRYVVDLNRPPDDTPLYPGQVSTGLVPRFDFDGAPLYLDGQAPDSNEMAERVDAYWLPYHQRLERELATISKRHGRAILFDCHSIVSQVPRLFEGTLPDFNLGTAGGQACNADLCAWLADALREDARYSLAVDARFKGGFVTRHYGSPEERIDAFQLELSIATYGQEDLPYAYLPDKADQVRPSLRRMLQAALDWAAEQAR